MGRHHKIVVDSDGLNRRETGYYSTPSFVSEFIARRLLSLNPNGHVVLDPCIGRGEMTALFSQANKKVIGFDVVDFSPDSVDDFRNEDFLKYYISHTRDPLFNNDNTKFDYIIANPPYNCHETEYIRKYKTEFVKIFGTSSVLNMYSMFLKAIINLAPTGCVIGVITLDSFLTARGHEDIRKHITSNCTVHNIHLCPTDIFLSQGADVRTCIMILEKGVKKDVKAIISNRPSSTQEFLNILDNEKFESVDQKELVLSGDQDRGEFLIDVPDEVRHLFTYQRIGNLYPCITGISTGNDKKYLHVHQSDEYSVPFYKNPGSRRFYTEPDAFLASNFLEIEKQVPNFMVRNKQFLFKGGISCSSMGVAFTASYLPDGATMGVNPNIIVNGNDRWWLMAYLNSSLCTYLVRGILIRSNMITAGYVSRIPIPPFSARAKNRLLTIAQEAYENRVAPRDSDIFVKAIDSVIFKELKITEKTKAIIKEFVSDVVRRT